MVLLGVSAAMAQAPVAEAPTYQAGDEWRYTTGSVFRVVAIEEGQVVTTLTQPALPRLPLLPR